MNGMGYNDKRLKMKRMMQRSCNDDMKMEWEKRIMGTTGSCCVVECGTSCIIFAGEAITRKT